MKGNSDSHCLVVLGKHLATEQRGHECGHALLAVNEEALTGGGSTVLELDCWIAPCDQIPNWIALIQGVKKIANFCRLPHEGPLDLRYSNLAGLYPRQQRFNWVWRDRVALSAHRPTFQGTLV